MVSGCLSSTRHFLKGYLNIDQNEASCRRTHAALVVMVSGQFKIDVVGRALKGCLKTMPLFINKFNSIVTAPKQIDK